MRRNTALTALGAVACLLGSAAVWAITFGEPDNGRHPFVGSVVAEFGGERFQFCSGTLVSPTVFVTAAHCLFGTEEEGIPIWVTFDEIIDANADGLIDAGVTLAPARPSSTRFFRERQTIPMTLRYSYSMNP
jgi:hypothetical protein